MDGVYFLEDCDVDAAGRILPLPDDEGKYSLVLIFAHWCHNCTGIKPEYASVAPKVASKVRLYAINGTGARHETPSRPSEQALMQRVPDMVQPFKFRGYPSVYLFDPAGKCVAEFTEARTADGLTKFLRANNAV